MYARMVTGRVALDKLDSVISVWENSVAPSVRHRKGFCGARLLVDGKTGKVVSIGLWETETDFQATIEWNQLQLAKFSELFETPPTVEGYYVAAEIFS